MFSITKKRILFVTLMTFIVSKSLLGIFIPSIRSVTMALIGRFLWFLIGFVHGCVGGKHYFWTEGFVGFVKDLLFYQRA